jgi:hypothetical protein
MMRFEKLLKHAARLALKVAQREIERILAKHAPEGVKVEASDEGVAISGKELKARVVSDPDVRNIAR